MSTNGGSLIRVITIAPSVTLSGGLPEMRPTRRPALRRVHGGKERPDFGLCRMRGVSVSVVRRWPSAAGDAAEVPL